MLPCASIASRASNLVSRAAIEGRTSFPPSTAACETILSIRLQFDCHHKVVVAVAFLCVLICSMFVCVP